MSAQWENIALDRSSEPSLAIRHYEGATRGKTPPLVLYLRGGAFLETGRDPKERPVPRTLADCGAVVIEADYASPSSNAFPKVLEWAFLALSCLSRRRKQYGSARSLLFVVGEEAGGNVAAGVALKARDRMPGELAGQVLLSPMIDPMMTSASIRRADEIGMRERWSDGWSHYLGSAWGHTHPYAAPCQCTRLAGVAPALVMTAQDDPLHDEALAYALRLEQSGVAVSRHVLPSGCGWTGIYRNEAGDWRQDLCDQFRGFVERANY